MHLPFSFLLLAAGASAHYRFSKLVIDGVTEQREWTSIRQTKNYQDDHGVTDVNSADIRCFQMKAGTGTATVTAGSDLGFVPDQGVTHPGPVQFYMARVPDGSNINTWEATGNVWFKVASINGVNPGAKTSGFTWPTYNKKVVSFTVPKSIPNGKYLVRVESIALHQAQSAGGAQFYLACAQVEVTGGGSGTPGPMVAFPGAYRSGGPGLIFSWQTTAYSPPGPAVWEG
ncbi:glycoside hydrolase family 61 protein-like protein [Cercophora newfieldiana]|uniref:lytic cellulose monooxygenase (C4-dehydrogenating) n=1 Tax=Cercophora newfieldiana TaxID=92897 RepID=A0AA39Y9T4_9PEZI|nr:glycoside hydrolase family 61 protein-like protein [Cercophora newfieldiana]